MNRRLSYILVFVFAMSLFSMPVLANCKKGHGDMCKKGDQMQTCPVVDKLKLSDKQSADIAAINTKYVKQMKSHKTKIASLKKKLDTAFRSSATNDAVQKIYNDLQAAKTAKHDLCFAKCLEIRALLTKEQLKNFGPCDAQGHHGACNDKKMCAKKSRS